MASFRPFEKGGIHELREGRIRLLEKEIEDLGNEYVLKSSPAELEEHFVSRVKFDPILFDGTDLQREREEATKIDMTGSFDRLGRPGERLLVSATRVYLSLPFSGDAELWHIQPSSFSHTTYPTIDIYQGRIRFSYTFPDDSPEPERLRQQIDRDIAYLKETISALGKDIEHHNQDAPHRIKASLARKREKATLAANAILALGIPMKRLPVPQFVVPIQRRPSPISRPVPTSGKFEPEPTLEQEEFEHILGVMRSMSLVMERCPEPFVTIGEEGIRTHFLIQLNGHYEGLATGETFNAGGKTDILIRVKDRNVFIAECKFWRGDQSFSGAIDQLLSYLSWRDSKCALVIFNRNVDSSAVRQKMHEIMEARPERKKTASFHADQGGRYIFVKESDPGREIQIQTLLFDVPN